MVVCIESRGKNKIVGIQQTAKQSANCVMYDRALVETYTSRRTGEVNAGRRATATRHFTFLLMQRLIRSVCCDRLTIGNGGLQTSHNKTPRRGKKGLGEGGKHLLEQHIYLPPTALFCKR